MKNFFKTILLALCLFTFAACKDDARTVKVAQFGKEKFLLYLPLYIAMEEGYFAQEGINIDLHFAGNDDQIFAAVASGAVDFGVGDPVFTAIAQEKGFPAKTVAQMIVSLGLSGYTNNAKIGKIETADDLAGLRVGSFPKPSTTYTLLDELIKKNPALKNTSIVEAPMGAQLALLESNQADIAVDLEPTVSIAESKGYRVVFNIGDWTDKQVITGLMAAQTTIDENPKAVQAMVNGLQRALTVMKNDKATAAKVARKLFPNLSAAVIDHAIGRMMERNMYPQSALVDDAYWQRTLQTRIDSGDLKAEQETSKSVDNSFALKARPK